MSMSSVLTSLLVEAIDSFQPTVWGKLRLPGKRLTAIRAGTSFFTDSQLKQISAAAGEPWWKLVLKLDKTNSEFTQATLGLCQELESLKDSAVRQMSYKSKASSHPKSRPRRIKVTTQIH